MIIQNILDTDLYKFTTSYAYIKLFPYAEGTFTFQDRDQTVYTEEFLKTAKREIEKLREVKLTSEEQEFMTHHCRFLPPVYWEWLASFRFNPEKIHLRLDEEGHLHMEVTDLLLFDSEYVSIDGEGNVTTYLYQDQLTASETQSVAQTASAV